MKITLEIDEIQLGKNYCFEFSVSEDGKLIKKSNNKPSIDNKHKEQKPSIEDFEKHINNNGPKLEEPKIKKEFKIESSFDGRIEGNL